MHGARNFILELKTFLQWCSELCENLSGRSELVYKLFYPIYTLSRFLELFSSWKNTHQTKTEDIVCFVQWWYWVVRTHCSKLYDNWWYQDESSSSCLDLQATLLSVKNHSPNIHQDSRPDKFMISLNRLQIRVSTPRPSIEPLSLNPHWVIESFVEA